MVNLPQMTPWTLQGVVWACRGSGGLPSKRDLKISPLLLVLHTGVCLTWKVQKLEELWQNEQADYPVSTLCSAFFPRFLFFRVVCLGPGIASRVNRVVNWAHHCKSRLMILVLGELMKAADEQTFTSYQGQQVYSVCLGSNRKSAVAQVAKEMGQVVHSLSGLILMPDWGQMNSPEKPFCFVLNGRYVLVL